MTKVTAIPIMFRFRLDNGPQFIAKDFKEFIRISGMTHVRTSPFYPAIERKDRTVAQIAQGGVHPPGTPLSLEDTRRLVLGYVDPYNNVRLNSATGHVTPKDMLAGRQQEIHADRQVNTPLLIAGTDFVCQRSLHWNTHWRS